MPGNRDKNPRLMSCPRAVRAIASPAFLLCVQESLRYQLLTYYSLVLSAPCFYIHQNADCPGRDLDVAVNIPLQECQKACSSSDQCASFQYYNNVCWAKGYACNYDQMTAVGNVQFNLFTKFRK
jgi:hypothetical protein